VAPKIPVGVGFTANASAAGFVFALVRSVVVIVAQTFAGRPMDNSKNAARKQGHDNGEV